MIIFFECKNIEVTIFPLIRTLLGDAFVLAKLLLLCDGLLFGYMHQIEQYGDDILIAFRLSFDFEFHAINYRFEKA